MAWYDQLFTDLQAFAAAVATDVKAITPRLIPSGGTDGQVLTKNGASAYATKWSTASGGSNPLTNPDIINGVLQATDQIRDVGNSSGTGNRQGYFHQIVAERSHLVGGICFIITRTGSLNNPGPLGNAVGIFDMAGNPLAAAEAAGYYTGSTGWKRVYFPTPITLVAGTRYMVGMVASGDNIPGFAATNGSFYYNYNAGSPLRCFRKYNTLTFGAAVNFSTDITENNSERIFLGLIPPA